MLGLRGHVRGLAGPVSVGERQVRRRQVQVSIFIMYHNLFFYVLKKFARSAFHALSNLLALVLCRCLQPGSLMDWGMR